MMRKQDKVVIWPAYFDSTLTRGKGRRVPKALSVPNPRISEVKEAVERLKLEYELVLDASYPKTPWLKTGKLLVIKKATKNDMIKRIADQLRKIRASVFTKG
ncbi:signal recognition particle protein Srp19 [Candidatus Bathyarchaeota archaeon]|nr:signal recognition particle protein Srp19 [Candidatus Bathyarchaeota archaeon]